MLLQWLGQSSFLLTGSSGRIGLDLYLSDHLATKYRGTDKEHERLHACPVAPTDLTDLRWIFASHKHSDHLDPGSIAEVLAGAKSARLVLPAPLLDYATDDLGLPPERLDGVEVGDQVGPFTILPAAHPDRSPWAVSAIVDVDGVRVFHSGDTLAFDELQEALMRLQPHLVLLPANGRVAQHLGTPPNMSLEEGIAMVKACGAPLVIPHHYELFAFNSRPVEEIRLVLAESGLPHLVPEVGAIVNLTDVLGTVAA